MERRNNTRRMNGFRLYWKYIAMHFRSGLQYKGWFLMVLQVLFVVVTDPISTVLLFSRFGSVGDWSMERILLMYAIAVTGYGFAESMCRGFDYFPWHMVRGGAFDRVLLRPRSTFVQVAASYFHIHRLARAVSGVAAIVWCLWRLEVPLTAGRAALLLYALAGGFVLYAGIFVFCAGIAFYTVKGMDWMYILQNGSYQVPRVPPPYMPKAMRAAFTFMLPLLPVCYYPASVICGWGEPLWTALLALPAGFLFLGAALAVWRVGVRHYNSTGS